MTRCATIQADGTLLVVGNDNDACYAGQVVLMYPADREFDRASPFKLSASDGGLISAAILLTWATAWGIKAAARALSAGDTSED